MKPPQTLQEIKQGTRVCVAGVQTKEGTIQEHQTAEREGKQILENELGGG